MIDSLYLYNRGSWYERQLHTNKNVQSAITYKFEVM